MKRYIKSAYTYDPWKNADMSEWSESDKRVWESIDWKARNYERYQDLSDSFKDILEIYGIDSEPIYIKDVTYVKEYSANTIFSPSFVVEDSEFEKIAAEYRRKGYPLVSPSYDGTTVTKDGVTYKVMDRADTVELYDMLSR